MNQELNIKKIHIDESYDVKPGSEAISYLISWFQINRLAKKSSKRDLKFFLDVTSGVDKAILNMGMFEKAILNIIKEICIKTGCTDQLFDIGANIGNHTVSLSKIFDKVHSVEPNPVIFKVLEANILRNNIQNVIPYNFGLAAEKSNAVLVATSEQHSLGKVEQHSTLGAEGFGITEKEFSIRHPIALESTRDFFSRFSGSKSKTFIKIDVEGMEQEILSQLALFIQSDEPIIGFEWYVKEQPGIKDIINQLHGYKAYVVDGDELSPQSALTKFISLIFNGRKSVIRPYDPNDLRPAYSLVLLVPNRFQII